MLALGAELAFVLTLALPLLTLAVAGLDELITGLLPETLALEEFERVEDFPEYAFGAICKGVLELAIELFPLAIEEEVIMPFEFVAASVRNEF